LSHLFQVDATVLLQQEASGFGKLAQKIVFLVAVLFAGLFFLSRHDLVELAVAWETKT
jgi:hypothetical protein